LNTRNSGYYSVFIFFSRCKPPQPCDAEGSASHGFAKNKPPKSALLQGFPGSQPPAACCRAQPRKRGAPSYLPSSFFRLLYPPSGLIGLPGDVNVRFPWRRPARRRKPFESILDRPTRCPARPSRARLFSSENAPPGTNYQPAPAVCGFRDMDLTCPNIFLSPLPSGVAPKFPLWVRFPPKGHIPPSCGKAMIVTAPLGPHH